MIEITLYNLIKFLALRIGFLLLIVILSSLPIQAQYRRLHVGDTVPDIAFNSVRNYSGSTKRLTDFKGKYIILDIWDKYCTACIAGMPKMQQLQNKFNDQLQILLVTKNTENGLSLLFKNSPIIKNVQLPMILGDSLLTKIMFPAEVLPHHVWLDKNFRVLAIVSGNETTEESVFKIINGEKVSFFNKDAIVDCDNISDGRNSLLTFNDGYFLKNVIFYKGTPVNTSFDFQRAIKSDEVPNYSLFTTRIDGCTRQVSIKEFKNSQNIVIGRLWYNMTICGMFQYAYDFSGPGVSAKVFIDSALPFAQMPATDSEEFFAWDRKSRFCYEAFFSDFTDEKFRERMRNDLLKAFGAKLTVEEREIPCLVLKQVAEGHLPYAQKNDPVVFENTKSKAGIVFSNTSFGMLTSYLQATFASPYDPEFLDESHMLNETKLTMTLKVTNWRDIEGLKRELGKYGLGLKVETRLIKVLVLKQVN